MLSPNTTNKVRKSTLITFINILWETLDIAIRKNKEIKDTQLKNEISMTLFIDDMIVKVKKPNEPLKKGHYN